MVSQKNVEWSGASWDIPTILEFGEVEINRIVEREWELQLGMVCQVLCDLNWLQVRSSYLSPGRQNLQIILNTTNIPTCLLYTSPSPRDSRRSRMPSSA